VPVLLASAMSSGCSNWCTSPPASAQRALTSTTDWIGIVEDAEVGTPGATLTTSQSPGFTVGDQAFGGIVTVVPPAAAVMVVAFARLVFFSTYGTGAELFAG